MKTKVTGKTDARKKRKGTRYPLAKPFQFTSGSQGEDKVSDGVIVDMSYSPGSGISGIGVHVNEKLEEGQEITMKSQHRAPRSAKATVKWVDHPDEKTFRAGLKFNE